MSNEIKKATESFTQHDACDDCGKRTDGLTTCTYSHDDSQTKLCPDCIKDSGFCLGCGYYWAGCESFDFSDMPGYCENCKDEIKANFNDDEDDDSWQPCDNCDLPDACEDFGCAIKNGIRQSPEW